MFVVVWQFEIAEDKVAAFETAYGPEGAWAQLFRHSADYQGTELLRDAYIPAFRKTHDAGYEKLDRECDHLTAKESRVGAYTV
jgi:hypothetical protein